MKRNRFCSVSVSTTAYSPQCQDNSIYYTTKNKSQLQVLLPQTRFQSDISELSVIPGCSYRVEVYVNPRYQPRDGGSVVIIIE